MELPLWHNRINNVFAASDAGSIPAWHSGLGIWHWHICGIGRIGNSICCGVAEKENQNKTKNLLGNFWKIHLPSLSPEIQWVTHTLQVKYLH